ncbi:invasion associated locus B family protein, partial [Vineibacter terrae]
LSPEFLAALKVGSTLTLKMQSSAGTELSIPVSLVGFTAAIDRMLAIK